LLVFVKERIPPAPQAYIEGRFGADPSKPTPAHRLARAFWAIDHRQRALEILERACVSSTDALDHFHFGLCLNEADRAGAAVPCLRRACELAPDVADPFFELGLTLVQLGDYPGAVDAFERAAAAAPDDFGIWANLAQVYKLIGSEPAMRRAARRAQELEPGEPLTAALLR
jgi:tetratricopeptide (TPR) repeat protein